MVDSEVVAAEECRQVDGLSSVVVDSEVEERHAEVEALVEVVEVEEVVSIVCFAC